jgi:hypothetical protein
VTANIEFLAKEGVRLGGGKGTQTVSVQSGAEGALCYEGGNTYDGNKRLTWHHDVTAHVELVASKGLDVSGNTSFQKGSVTGTNWCLYGEIDGDENGKMLYAYTNNPGDADAVNYMGRMTAETNLVNKGYVDKAMEGAAIGYAELDANQEFTGTNRFKNPTYFESSIISSSNTSIEFKGKEDWENHEDRHIKVRGGIAFNIYAYPGNNNNTPRKALSLKWIKDTQYPTLELNYLPDPTANGNPVNLRYANNTYLKKEDYVAPVSPKPVIFKSDQYVRAYTGTTPPAGYASFINAPEPGGQTNSNYYFGNCNNGVNIAIDKLLNAKGERFAEHESYDVSGYITVIGKEDGKVYMKAAVDKVRRLNNYINVHFPGEQGWVPAITFGTGNTSDQNYFLVTLETYEA